MSATNWTIEQIADQSGKTVLITGGTSGIGLEAARVLSLKHANVVLTARNDQKGKATVDFIKSLDAHATVDWLVLDLADLDSIQSFSKQFKASHTRLDMLINNAGVMYPPSRQETKDGFELQFGTNHLGHFALTASLLDLMKSTPDARITTQSSIAHRLLFKLDFQDLNWEKRYNKHLAYAQSKLANLLFTYELDRRLKAKGLDMVANAAHPGVTHTNLFRTSGFETFTKRFMQKPEMGALPILRAATEPWLKGSEYVGPDGFAGIGGYPIFVSSTSVSKDANLSKALWEASERLTNIKFDV